VTSSPAVANGVVYVFAGDWNLYALNAKTGAKLWSYAISKVSIASGSPVVANAVVYIDPGKRDVYAFGLKQDRK
jgi:outer membrane protein assembly factor BamB